MKSRALLFAACLLSSACSGVGETGSAEAPAAEEASAAPGPVPGPKSGRIVKACTAEPDAPLKEICGRSKIPYPLQDARLVVRKAGRAVELYSGDVKLKTYAAALGGRPTGPKRVRGDERTPEGEYYLIRHVSPSFGPCFYIAYPNAQDAEEGVRRGIVSKAEKAAILAKLRSKGIPPKGTALGSLILLHGTKDRTEACLTDTDWTLGCVALDNPHIVELLHAIAPNTHPPITILP